MTIARRQFGSVIIAALIVILGVILGIDSYRLLDPDAYVFPRVIIIVMTMTGTLVVIRDLWQAQTKEPQPQGDGLRRFLLILLMLMTVALVPFIGMALGLVVLMAAAIELSRFESWTVRQRLALHGSGLILAITFTVLFREFLYVPLPTGSLWN